MIEFKEYGQPLTMVYSFKYLVQKLTEVDDNWPSVITNLWKTRKVWARLSRILQVLGREGADLRTSGRFYIV